MRLYLPGSAFTDTELCVYTYGIVFLHLPDIASTFVWVRVTWLRQSCIRTCMLILEDDRHLTDRTSTTGITRVGTGISHVCVHVHVTTLDHMHSGLPVATLTVDAMCTRSPLNSISLSNGSTLHDRVIIPSDNTNSNDLHLSLF